MPCEVRAKACHRLFSQEYFGILSPRSGQNISIFLVCGDFFSLVLFCTSLFVFVVLLFCFSLAYLGRFFPYFIFVTGISKSVIPLACFTRVYLFLFVLFFCFHWIICVNYFFFLHYFVIDMYKSVILLVLICLCHFSLVYLPIVYMWFCLSVWLILAVWPFYVFGSGMSVLYFSRCVRLVYHFVCFLLI